MKVLIVTTVFQNSIVGAGTFIHSLRKYFDGELHVLTENTLETKDIHSIDYNPTWLQSKFGLQHRRKFYFRKLREVKGEYDIVLFNHPLLALDIPFELKNYAIILHDYESISNKELGVKQRLSRIYQQKLIKRSLLQSPHIIANSNFTKSKFCATQKINEDQISVFRLGIDLSCIEYKPNSKIYSPIKVLFVKNDLERGGLYILLEALKLLSEFKFELTIVGDKPRFARNSSLSHVSIKILGATSHKDVLELMYTHDIFCVPSIREALGLANMEAMASGIAVVTSDAGGIPEVVTSNEGWISEAGSVASLSHQIGSLLEENTARLSKIENARKRVASFDYKRTSMKLKLILNEIIKQ